MCACTSSLHHLRIISSFFSLDIFLIVVAAKEDAERDEKWIFIEVVINCSWRWRKMRIFFLSHCHKGKERMGDEVKWAGERLRAKIADDAKKIHLALSREIFNPWMKYNLIYIFIHGSNLKKKLECISAVVLHYFNDTLNLFENWQRFNVRRKKSRLKLELTEEALGINFISRNLQIFYKCPFLVFYNSDW